MADSTLNTLLKGASVAAVGMFVSKALTYLYRAVVARMIGPEAYGQLSLGLVVLSLGVTAAMLGMNQGLQNFVSKYRSRQDREAVRGIVKSVMHISLPLSVLAAVTIYLSSGFIAAEVFDSPGLAQILKVFALIPPFAVFSKISIATTVGFKKIRYRVFTNQLFQPSVQLVATVVLVYLGYGVLGAAFGWFLGVALSSILAYYFMRKLVKLSGGTAEHRKEMLKYSYPLFLSGIIGTVLGWADTAFLGYFMDDAAVGFYNAALPTAMLILVPYQALGSLSLPSLSEIVERDEEKLSHTLKSLTRWTLYITFPAFVLMALFSPQVLHVLFGAEYSSAAPALMILAFGYLFNTSVGHLNDVLKSIDKTQIIFRNSVANVAINIVLNILLIPVYGLIGAAVATTASVIFINTLLVAETYYFEGFLPFSRHSWKPVVAALPGLLLVYLSLHQLFNTVPYWSLFPGAAAFGTLYLLALVMIGGVTEEDREVVLETGQKFGQEEPAEKLVSLVELLDLTR